MKHLKLYEFFWNKKKSDLNYKKLDTFDEENWDEEEFEYTGCKHKNAYSHNINIPLYCPDCDKYIYEPDGSWIDKNGDRHSQYNEDFDFNEDDFDFEEEDEMKEIFDRSNLIDFQGKKVYDLVVGNMYIFRDGAKVCYIGKSHASKYPVLCLIIKGDRLIEWIPHIPLTPMNMTIKEYMSNSKTIKRKVIDTLFDEINGNHNNGEVCSRFYKNHILD